jgi:uncharacterized protein YcaQ
VADISSAEARRLALASLGFGGPRSKQAGVAHVRSTANRLGAIQVDSVNVLARAHYLPTFSRHGQYAMSILDDLAHTKRELFEYWGHAACLLPMEIYPLMRWRMENQIENWSGIDAKRRTYIEAVFQEIAERGPIAAGDISIGGKSTGPWWGWSDGRQAVEFLFRQGRIALAGRKNFERLYDLSERVIPAATLTAPRVVERDAKKELIVRAARAMGVGTAKDIAQYFHVDGFWDRNGVGGRKPASNMRALFDELEEDQRLERVSVEGWKQPGYVVPGVKIPKSIDTRAVVSPFDPLMWERSWTRAVFGFEYQIEIYVPAPKRVYGYYVLPFLLGDAFAARVDLKADRKSSTLIVHSAYREPGRSESDVASALADELRLVARWLSLDAVKIGRKGDLARSLGRAIKSSTQRADALDPD